MHLAAASDKELVLQILSGQREAFSTLVERYLRSALAIARARLLNPIDADDAVQEAFLRAYSQLRTLREPAKFGPWLLTIVRHEAARFVARGRSTMGADPASAPEAVAEPNPSQREVHAILRSRIEQLPETAREVLLLHYFAGRNTREIATLLGIRQGAVLKRLQRAREALAESMLRDLEAERPSTESLTRQATRIAAIAMTVGVPAVGTATVLAIAPPALTFFSTKVITVAGAVALVAGTITYFISNGSSEPRRVLVAASDTQTALTPQTPAQTPSAPQPSPDAAAPPVTVQESAPAAAGGTEPRVDPHAALDLTVTLEFETVHVAGILAEVEGLTGVPILVDRRAVGLPAVPFLITTDAAPSAPYPISGMLAEVHIRNQRLDAVLDLLARELGLRAVWEPGYVWISTQNNIFQDMTPATPARYAIYAEKDRERRASIVQSIEFENVHISEVLEFLNEVYEVNFVLDSRVVAPPSKTPAMMASVPSGKVTDGVVSYINLRNVQMPELLTVLSRLTNTTSFVLRDYVWFTTRGRASSDGLTQVKPNPALAKTLASQVSVAFEDVRMEEIFDFLRDIYGINLFVDPRITAWEEEPGDAVPFRGASASAHSGNLSHGLIHSLYCRELSVRSVLDIVTQSLKLTHTVQGDAIVISSRDASRSGTPDAADFIPSSKFAEAGTEAVKAYRKSLQVMQSRPVACAEITLLRIESADEVRAEIDVCGTPKWYKVGDSFAPYRVYRIDPVKQQVLLYNDDTDRTQPFFVAH